jgi:hypothetical protein
MTTMRGHANSWCILFLSNKQAEARGQYNMLYPVMCCVMSAGVCVAVSKTLLLLLLSQQSHPNHLKTVLHQIRKKNILEMLSHHASCCCCQPPEDTTLVLCNMRPVAYTLFSCCTSNTVQLNHLKTVLEPMEVPQRTSPSELAHTCRWLTSLLLLLLLLLQSDPDRLKTVLEPMEVREAGRRLHVSVQDMPGWADDINLVRFLRIMVNFLLAQRAKVSVNSSVKLGETLAQCSREAAGC